MAAARRDGGNAVAVAINASDEIVGYIIDPATGEGTGFLNVNGQSYDLNSLLQANSGWEITGAQMINDGGEIVGAAVNASGYTGVSLKPQSSSRRWASLPHVN